MRPLRWLLAGGLAILLLAAVYLTLLGLELWGHAREPGVKAVGGDDQELAWIEPATSGDEWGRLVSGLNALQRDWAALGDTSRTLEVDLEHAFPRLTADVPELAIYFSDAPGHRLWVRWYKISGEVDGPTWVGKLRARARPPLAVVGGGTSGRAQKLATALEDARGKGWTGDAPLFLITTATAEDVKGAEGVRLMGLYPGRTFRFSFTNRRIVEAVFSFLDENPQVWINKGSEASVLAGAVALGDPLSSLVALTQGSSHFLPCRLYTVYWEDDSYSRDLAEIFWELFNQHHPRGQVNDVGRLPYSVGDFYHPNIKEHASVGTFLSELSPIPPHSLLVLPTGVQRMRRYLGNLCRRAPLDARNLVVVNGDAISFHNVYRDRDFAWNVQDLPVSLVFFSHRNPIDASAGFGWERDEKRGLSTTGTHDLLMYRDIFEAVLHAAFDRGRLLAGADAILPRLRATRWHQADDGPRSNRVANTLVHPWASASRPFFDAEGNRAPRTGEHVVWLRPNYSGDRLDLSSTITVWEVRPEGAGATWRAIASHQASYNQPRFED